MSVPKKVIKLLGLFAIIASILLISSPVRGASWWKQDWNHRKKLTFDNSAISEALTNFPVLVALSSTNFDFSKAQTNGADIRLIDADDTTVLKHEIEKWEESGTNAWIWVNVPKIDAGSSNDFVYIYYGNSGVADAQDAENVWDGNYMMVQHLEETSGTHYDSTSNNNDGTPAGANQNVAGKINSADEFYGTNDYVSIADSASLDITNVITLEAWVKNLDLSPDYWGNQCTNTGYSAYAMDNTNNKVSMRFTAEDSKTVTNIYFYNIGTTGTSPVYRIGLQGDNAGVPDGTWLAGGTAYVDTQLAIYWNLCDISNAVITQGTVYHVVAEYQSGTINSTNKADLRGLTPNLKIVPYTQSIDPNYNVCKDTGSGWVVQNRDPMFVLIYTDSTSAGQPYDYVLARQIYTNRYYGEQIVLPTDMSIDYVDFLMKKTGTPADLCYVTLYNRTDAVEVFSEVITETIETTDALVSHKLSTTFQLVAGKTYQIYLKSPGSTSGAYYMSRAGQIVNNIPALVNRSFGGSTQCEAQTTGGVIPLQAIVYIDSVFLLSTEMVILSKAKEAYALGIHPNGTGLYGYVNTNSISASIASPTDWHHYVWTYDGSEQKLYIDGTETNSTSVSGAITTNDNALTIGNFFNGIIDELRISKVPRSAGWIKASYLSGNDTYLTYGAQELVPPPRGTVLSVR